MEKVKHSTDLCVVGGGLAGICTAISAARHGIKVVLMHERPVLGGNASSEIRMCTCGAQGKDDRETGIVEEILLENFYRNTNSSYSIWDSVLYEKVRFEKNITLLLNCSCYDCKMDGNKIVSVSGWQMTTQQHHIVEADFFADCSGDSVLAPLSGAEFMRGREAKSDYNETIPPDTADSKTMGMSCLIQLREYPGKQKFIPPEWAYKYEKEEDLAYKDHNLTTNFWWIEVGGEDDEIADTEKMRDELLKIAFGVWDHMKNYGDHGVDNWNIDWIGFLPGKRESRRYKGDVVITQNDVEAEGRFEDIVAYAGWSMDDHFPAGFYYKEGHPTIYHKAPSPWGIPFRSLYSKNIDNLLFAGRNISVTHAALSSSRVMLTCGIVGQAVGTAIAQAKNTNMPIRSIDIPLLQQTLMEDDCFIPWHTRERWELTKLAKTNCEIARCGMDRDYRGENNKFAGKKGDYIEYSFDDYCDISEIRILFDSNLGRTYHNLPCHFPLKQTVYKTPGCLVKEYKIMADTPDGEIELVNELNNYQRLVNHKVSVKAKSIRLIPVSAWDCETLNVFALDVR